MKTILVTGATGNLGAVVVDYFATKGYQVFAFVSPGKSQVIKCPSLKYVETDLTNEVATAEQVASIGAQHSIDAAILLAGGFAMGDIAQTSLEGIHNMIRINFDTAYTVVRPIHNLFDRQKGGGKIIFVGARPAVEWRESNSAIGYALSKGMLIHLAESINQTTHGNHITASVLVPSIIDTPANRETMPNANFSSWIKPEVMAQQIESMLLQQTDVPKTLVKLY